MPNQTTLRTENAAPWSGSMAPRQVRPSGARAAENVGEQPAGDELRRFAPAATPRDRADDRFPDGDVAEGAPLPYGPELPR